MAIRHPFDVASLCRNHDELKSIIVYSCETARKYHYHDPCLRAALRSVDDENIFPALRIIRGIQYRDGEKERMRKTIADALEFLDERKPA